MSLLDAPIWNDPGTWIVLGVSLLFLVVAAVMHRIIMKVVRGGPDARTATPAHSTSPQPARQDASVDTQH